LGNCWSCVLFRWNFWYLFCFTKRELMFP
jgi:hypothetical protein